MMGLTFLAPFALIALAALPALYFLLRLTPPSPRRLPLPTLPLVRDLIGTEREPRRTPLWLLILRLAAAAALILAVASPRFQPEGGKVETGSGPLVLMMDDSWTAAPDWALRVARATALLEQAAERPVTFLAMSDEQARPDPETARSALARIRALQPKPYPVNHTTALAHAEQALASAPSARLVWITTALAASGTQDLLNDFLERNASRIAIIAGAADAATITGLTFGNDGVDAHVRRFLQSGETLPLALRALDAKGRLLGESLGTLADNSAESGIRLTLPLELLNEIERVELSGQRHAGGTFLVDAGSRRRRIALVSGETTDTAQPLVSGRYFVARALQPFAELREAPAGAGDAILKRLEERPDGIVLVDIGTLSGEVAEKLGRFVEEGGLLIRFASQSLAAATDDLLPVRIRRGGRTLGGALSWEKPRKMAPYPEGSPFADLPLSADIRIERQVLAEPDSDLSRLTLAMLEDGTPLITAAPRGKGRIVLFHVTADTSWSNLPLSGQFMDMLRRIVLSAALRHQEQGAGDAATTQMVPPRLALDGFGTLGPAPGTARAVAQTFRGPVSALAPPGLYGPPEASLALNITGEAGMPAPLSFGTIVPTPLAVGGAVDYRPILLILGLLLVLADGLAVILLARGGLGLRRSPAPVTAALILALGLALIPGYGVAQTQAKPPLPQIPTEDIRSSLKPRLGYILTGQASVDETSKLGLTGLGQVLAQRTSIILDEPAGLDPARDELVFYPMIYWPVIAGSQRPSEAALRAIDTYMKNGGTVVFDTRDAFVQRPGSQPSAETRTLRAMLATLDIPALEPVPQDHVLTKTFYLLERFTGRYVAGDTWVEALTGRSDAKVPARAGDRVSPVIITSNDLAAAWATDRVGRPLYPLVPGEPRQREMALRTGVNIVMYVMTGNYKADQVHVPALLERLGQ